MSLQRKIGPIILFLARLGDAICSTFERGALHSFFLQHRIGVPISKLKPSCGTYNSLEGEKIKYMYKELYNVHISAI